MNLVVVLTLLLSISTFATVVFQDSGISSLDDWTVSQVKDNLGEIVIDDNLGIKTSEDARSYAISRGFDTVSTKDQDLVFSFTLRNDQDLKCGGAYVKLMSEGFVPSQFNSDSSYEIMFGPDRCGYSTDKIHFILQNEETNHDWKKSPKPVWDDQTHLYSFLIRPDNTYTLSVDGEVVESGSLKDDWDILPPREIEDPEAEKPDDWVDSPMMVDPEAEKPDDWPEDEPELINDPDAEIPEDWDEEEDGEWQAPLVPNPEYRGEWKAPMIENPSYVGPWSPPMIENPDFSDDDTIYQRSIAGIGIEIWQVESGSVFDNFFLAVGPEAEAEAEAFAASVFAPIQEAEIVEAAEAAAEAEEVDADEHDL